MSPRSSLFVLVLALSLALGACTTDEFVRQAGVPGTSSGGSIENHGLRDHYHDVSVATGGTVYRFFLPPSEECRAVSEGGEDVRYRNLGLFGRIEVDGTSCDPVGILSLVEWRDRRPRPKTRQTIPRDQATYAVYYRDEELALARGRFRLTGLIGIPGGIDYVAAIPMEPACQGLLDEKVASIEFRSSGALPFSLVGASGPCPILGFAQVVSPPSPSPETAE